MLRENTNKFSQQKKQFNNATACDIRPIRFLELFQTMPVNQNASGAMRLKAHAARRHKAVFFARGWKNTPLFLRYRKVNAFSSIWLVN